MKQRKKDYLVKIVSILSLISGIFLLNSCYYDNEEELYPQAIPCDTLNVIYSGTIAPIMQNNCNDCHGGAAPTANIRTDTYEGLKNIAENDKLWGSINHESGYSPMPKDRPKLSECNLSQIRIWLDDGALNN